MAKIVKVHGREVIDSRGNPTVEAEVHLEGGFVGLAIVPSGASTGSREALELRDGDKSRFLGKGVLKAVENVNGPIAKAVVGKDALDQAAIDQVMLDLDGTDFKSNLGANSILAVSLATAKAAAAAKGVPLYQHIADLNGTPGQYSMPLPMMNIINGGEHADNNIDLQEFMIQPVGAKTVREAIRMGSEVFHNLAKVLHAKGMNTAVGDEGGFAPNMKNSEEALQALHDAIVKAGYKPGEDIAIACDCAASYFYNKEDGKYHFEGKVFNDEELAQYYDKLLDEFPELISIEDPYDENDVDGMIKFTQSHKERIQIVLDDFICTNPKLLTKAIKEGAGNASLIKLNQIGTVTETLETIRLSRKNGYNTMISHRSGETGDTFIADFAVAVNGGQLKTGAPARSERVEKYNRLLEIEEELGEGERLATFPDSVDKD